MAMITAQLTSDYVTGKITTKRIVAAISADQSYTAMPTVDYALKCRLSVAEGITAGITNETEIYKVKLKAIGR